MPIDPRIALGLQVPDIAGSIAGGVKLGDQIYEMKRKKAADRREDDLRAALGDILTGNGSFGSGDAVGASPENAAVAIGNASKTSAYDRAARADPEAYLKFQGVQTDLTARRLKAHAEINALGMQLLGGVNDQDSYDRAKAQAKALYQQFGEDPSAIDQLPPAYSPDLVKSLQMQGMDTAHQLQAIARENKLNWDEYDDQTDNERADRNLDSLNRYRQQSIDVRERGQNMTDARIRASAGYKGSGKGGKPPTTEQALYTAIRAKWAAGETPNPREQAWAKYYERKQEAKTRGKKGGGVSAGDGAIIVNPKTKQRMRLQNGQWVPIP